MEEINAIRALDGSAPVFDHTPPPTGDIHARSEWIVVRIGGDGAVAGEEVPRRYDLEGNQPWALETVTADETCMGRAGLCSRGGEASVGFASTVTFADIAIPNIEFEEFPTPPFPFTARLTSAIGGRGNATFLRRCTGSQPETAKECEGGF